MSDFPSLAGQLLIAMPGLHDPHFENTVTLICEHSPDGAMGITINRPTTMLHGDVFEQLDEYQDIDAADRNALTAAEPILKGGPVSPERGFVLHGEAGDWDATIDVADGIYVTMSRDILSAMLGSDAPRPAVMALGFAGWDSAQLEQEIRDNAWLTTAATAALVFETPYASRWDEAAAALGVTREQLGSGPAGHA